MPSCSFDVPISSLARLNEEDFFAEQPYDICRLGIWEVIAAELQGCRLALNGQWTLLLKGKQPLRGPLSVTRRGDTILFDVDDSDCLLGDNYLTLAVDAK